MNKLLLSATIALLVGCAPKPMLVKSVTPEQNAIDNAECNLEAQKATQAQTNDLMFEAYKNRAVSNCLQAKGYTYQAPPTPEQRAIADKHKAAIASMIAKDNQFESEIMSCLPLDDKGYVECISKVRQKQRAHQVYIDLYDSYLSRRKEYENMLIRKDINRLQFKEEIAKLFKEYIDQSTKRSDADIKNAIYTGNPNL